MVIALLGFGLRGVLMLCHCSFLFYRRQLVIWKRPHLRVCGGHDNVPLTSLTAESIIDPGPSCCALKFISTSCQGHGFYLTLTLVSENSRDTTCKSVSRRHRTTVMGNFDSRTSWKPCWNLFRTALQSQMLLPHFPVSIFSFTRLYLQRVACWWLSRPLRTFPFLLS